jgi:hypothetical protein
MDSSAALSTLRPADSPALVRLVAQLMQRLRQLGFLHVALRDPNTAPDDGRVMQLFRNRIELKKSFSAALEESQRLKDRVKQQEGATARVQELLQDLERRLSQPESGYQSLVFYQLKDLWSLGQRLLQQFVSELETQQVERERRNFFAEFNRRQFAQRQTVESNYLQAEGVAAAARARVSELERQVAALQRFWHYFRRRALRHELHIAGIQVLLGEQTLAEARAARDALAGEQPNFSGLSIDSRRAINLAAVAYAQALRERLTGSGLFEATHRASARREPAGDEYGTRKECERKMSDIQRARVLLEQRGDVLTDIRTRAEALRRLARYRGEGDSVPEPASLADDDPAVSTQVLVEDCWEIYRVLLR